MRSWKTAVLRGTCAMFGNRCCYLLHHHYHHHHHHHQLLPMGLLSVIPAIIIILITVIIGTGVEAIQFADSFPSSGRYGPEGISTGMRIQRNASSYLVQRLRDLRRGRKSNDLQANNIRNENDIISSERFTGNDASTDRNMQIGKDRFAGFRFLGRMTTIGDKQQQTLERKSKLLQQTQNMILTGSPPVPKSIPLNFSRLTNRQDCNSSDCLKNNDAISLYIPQENSTNDGQPPPLLLLSNNPSSSNNRINRNSQESTTLKLPKLHTGIKVMGPGVQEPQNPIPLPPPDIPYHNSQTNSKNNGEYGGVKLSGVGLIPPFAGGAELTDFIQPIDTALQTHHIYENSNHISSIAYNGKNKHYLLSASGNRGIYNDFHPAPLIPFSPKLEIYESVTLSSPSIYSTYSAQSIDYHPTSSSTYGSQYDSHSVSLLFNELYHRLITYVAFILFINSYFFFLQAKKRS
ncbi:hypothetical protein LOAG_12477 [Loa loa]|uniref:Uncharacterized protein n=1 Tax=Loa loa TaxID=7209 RepID=A0A1S0TL51_LOALO|nr:hypothetical protein LOAG_12477 [Loa loa]EFO16031.2 hypothetical protein LOAG_12477 [Loa loa]